MNPYIETKKGAIIDNLPTSSCSCFMWIRQRSIFAAQRLQGVAAGAIASDYQRLRVEAVCTRLGLTRWVFAFV